MNNARRFKSDSAELSLANQTAQGLIINGKDADQAVMFARFHGRAANIPALQQVVLEKADLFNLSLFAEEVEGADVVKLSQRIIELCQQKTETQCAISESSSTTLVPTQTL